MQSKQMCCCLVLTDFLVEVQKQGRPSLQDAAVGAQCRGFV